LTIGTGFVVDDAIVMIENIVRHMRTAKARCRRRCGRQGNRLNRDFADGVVDRRLHPAAVHVGLVGACSAEFALTLTIAVVTSAIISLTLTPMMCSRLLKLPARKSGYPALPRSAAAFDRMVNFYHRSLLWVLQRPARDAAGHLRDDRGYAGHVCGGAKGFLPLQDTASITAVTQAGPDVSFAEIAKAGRARPPGAIKADPDVIGVVSVIGGGWSTRTTNAAGW